MKLDQLFVKAVVSEVRCLTVKSTFPTRPGKIKWGLEKIQQLATQPRKNERIFHIITQSKHLLSEPNANMKHHSWNTIKYSTENASSVFIVCGE